MSTSYEDIKAAEAAEVKRLLNLVACGKAVQLKCAWLMLTSGVGIHLVLEPEPFDRLCNLLGSDEKGAVKFAVYTFPLSVRTDVWLRADTMCYVLESRNEIYILVDGEVKSISRNDLPKD